MKFDVGFMNRDGDVAYNNKDVMFAMDVPLADVGRRVEALLKLMETDRVIWDGHIEIHVAPEERTYHGMEHPDENVIRISDRKAVRE